MGRVPPSPWAFPGRLSALLGLLPALLAPSGRALAQGDAGCDVPNHGGMVMQTIRNFAGDDRIFYFTTPTIRCPGGVLITADSAVVYESTNYTNLLGNVVFRDEDSRLTADRAQYFSEQRRLVAQENAVLTDLTEGSVITGEQITLIRAGPDRAEDHLVVTGGDPHATLYPTPQPEAEVVPPDTSGQGGATVSSDSVTVPPDSVVIPADSVTVPPDSVVIPADSVTVPPDSVVLPDSTGFPPSAATHGNRILPEGEVPPPPLEDVPPISEVSPDPDVERLPYEIDAQRFVLEGTQVFRAIGSVVVTRDSLTAVADSLDYEQGVGALNLSGRARVTTAQTDLAAKAIRLDIPQDEVRGAIATGEAVLEGQDLRLLAPMVYLFFTQGRIERLMARRDPVADSIAAEAGGEPDPEEGPRRSALHPLVVDLGLEAFPFRPYAIAQDFILEGDSVEVLAPGEVLEEVWAMGTARGESMIQDSLTGPETLPLISRDWLEGDTIVAYFGEPGDTLPETSDSLSGADQPLLERDVGRVEDDPNQPTYQLKKLVARLGARSMYRMAPSDSTLAAEGKELAIHYVIGDEITIILNQDGEAERMEVVGQTRGIHLEPLPGRVEPADTLTVPDTSSINRGDIGPSRVGPVVGFVRRGGGSRE